MKNNTLIVAQGSFNKNLMSIGLIAEKINWINNDEINFPFFCQAKIRYRQTDVFCNIKYINNFSIKVLFDSPVIAVTPGQSIVFYLSEICIGGGVIKSRLPFL